MTDFYAGMEHFLGWDRDGKVFSFQFFLLLIQNKWRTCITFQTYRLEISGRLDFLMFLILPVLCSFREEKGTTRTENMNPKAISSLLIFF